MEKQTPLEKYSSEIESMVMEMAMFGRSDYGELRDNLTVKEVQEIMQKIAAFRARLFFLSVGFKKYNDVKLIRLKTDLIDPFINELSEQFTVWSRIFTLMQHEYDMSR